MEEQQKELSRILKIQIQKQNFEINFPNVGQLIDIEVRKSLISAGQYQNLIKNQSFSIDYIDALATFLILIPDLNKLLRVESIFDLNLIDIKEIINIYKKEYLPWYEEWMKNLNQ